MNDIRGGRITRQVPGSSNLVKALKAANGGINHVQRLAFHSNGAFTTLLSDIPKTVFQSNFGPTQERDKWRVPL